MAPKKIRYIGDLNGNYIRFAPNFGWKLGKRKWSRLYKRTR